LSSMSLEGSPSWWMASVMDLRADI
jgi:hypothetical protein